MVGFGASDTLGDRHRVPTHSALVAVVKTASKMKRFLVESLEVTFALERLDAAVMVELGAVGSGALGDFVLALGVGVGVGVVGWDRVLVY